jgi:hypothetical protein
MLGSLSSDIKSKKFEVSPGGEEKTYSFFLHSRTPDFAGQLIKDLESKKGILKISVE